MGDQTLNSKQDLASCFFSYLASAHEVGTLYQLMYMLTH